MIGGPSDTDTAQKTAEKVLEEWNREEGQIRNIRLQPKHWRIDARPTSLRGPQEAIDAQLVDQSHAGVAIFHQKLGSVAADGKPNTVHEIERFAADGREV